MYECLDSERRWKSDIIQNKGVWSPFHSDLTLGGRSYVTATSFNNILSSLPVLKMVPVLTSSHFGTKIVPHGLTHFIYSWTIRPHKLHSPFRSSVGKSLCFLAV